MSYARKSFKNPNNEVIESIEQIKYPNPNDDYTLMYGVKITTNKREIIISSSDQDNSLYNKIKDYNGEYIEKIDEVPGIGICNEPRNLYEIILLIISIKNKKLKLKINNDNNVLCHLKYDNIDILL